MVKHLKTLATDIHRNLIHTYSMVGNKEAKFKPNLREMREVVKLHEKTLQIMSKKMTRQEMAEVCSPKDLSAALRLIVDDDVYKISPPFRVTCKNLTVLLGDPL